MGILVNGADYKVPVKDSGELYMYELVTFGASERFYADSADEILEYLIPEYDAKGSPAENIRALLTHAFMVQTHLQSHINAAMLQEFNSLNPNEQHFLLNPNNPLSAPAHWKHSIPVVLVDASFQPYTEVHQPAEDLESDRASILWLKPAQGAYNYLLSLDEAGYIVLAATRNGAV